MNWIYNDLNLSVTEMRITEIGFMVDYFLDSEAEFLIRMGVDKSKLPKRGDWINEIELEMRKPVEEMSMFHTIWSLNGSPIGHSKLTGIEYGIMAKMHLHIWDKKNRKTGLGPEFLRKTIPLYFAAFNLSYLVCEPCALNTAPNRVMEKLGFSFERTYETVPGWITFYQPVCRYVIKKEELESNFEQ